MTLSAERLLSLPTASHPTKQALFTRTYTYEAKCGLPSKFVPRASSARGLVTMKYIATALQVADIFTKQLFPKHFARIRRVLLGEQSYEDMAKDYEQHKLQGDNPDDPQTWNKAPSSQGPSGSY